MDPIAAFAAHVHRTRYEDLPQGAVTAAKTFILDSFGVGLAGSAGPYVPEILATQAVSSGGEQARVWSHGMRLSAAGAALVNSYQMHNSEFDCLHEAAVAHVMTVVLQVAMAGAEREGGVTGRDLILACALGVDVASCMGVAAQSGLRFFRPATVGAFGAAAALGKLMRLDAPALVNAFSLAYGQLCGTMQAHTEGNALLALQVGFNARNAVVACDLAKAGFDAPKNILEGPFGYYRLIEEKGDPGAIVATLGKTWRMSEVAHKPFPSGRATHGIMDAAMQLQKAHGFTAAEIDRVTARVPPLVHHLVGRRPKADMAINYARLCASYTTARLLMNGFVGVSDFEAAAMNDPASLDLAGRIAVEISGVSDPNALVPVSVEIVLKNGQTHEGSLDVVYGNPANPMTREAHLDKFRRNAAAAAKPLQTAQVDSLIARVDELDALGDVTALVDLLVAR